MPKRFLIDIEPELHKRYKKIVQQIPFDDEKNYTVKTHTEMLIQRFVKKNDIQIELPLQAPKKRVKTVK